MSEKKAPIQDVLRAISTVTTGQIFTAFTQSGSEQRFVFYKSDGFQDQGGIFWVAAEDDQKNASQKTAVSIDVNLGVEAGKSADFKGESAAQFADNQCFSIRHLHLAAKDAEVAQAWIRAVKILVQRRQEAVQQQNDDGGTIVFKKGRRLSITISQARGQAGAAAPGPKLKSSSSSEPLAVFVGNPNSSSVKAKSPPRQHKRTASPRGHSRKNSSVYHSFKAELLMELRSEIRDTVVNAIGGTAIQSLHLNAEAKSFKSTPSPNADLLSADVSAMNEEQLREHVLSLRGVVTSQKKSLEQAERHRAKRAEMIPRLLQKSFDLESSLDSSRAKIQRLSNKVFSLEKTLADAKRDHAKAKREFALSKLNMSAANKSPIRSPVRSPAISPLKEMGPLAE